MTRNGRIAAGSVRSCFRSEGESETWPKGLDETRVGRADGNHWSIRPCHRREQRATILEIVSKLVNTPQLELDYALRQPVEPVEARCLGGSIADGRHDTRARPSLRLGDQHRLYGNALEGGLGSAR